MVFIKKITVFFFLFCSVIAFSEENPSLFKNEVDTLNNLGWTIINGATDEEKIEANEKYKTLLLKMLQHPASFSEKLDSLKTISILTANEKVRLYNWVVSKAGGTFEYFAFLQIKKEKDQYQIIELIDYSEKITSPEGKILTPKTWYGALYHEMIHHKKIGNDYYTLLGWDGNNLLSNKKIIDVIVLKNNGMVQFGAPIFKGKEETKKRVVFEYSANSTMSLKYDKKQQKIIFDYLVPSSSSLKGIREYYGPALDSFDAFLMGKKKWVFESNTEVISEKNRADEFYNSPTEE